MKKIIEFFKSNTIVLRWTVEYFVCFGLLLWFVFNFNVFSQYHWWKFFHATLHGFGGMVFGLMMYSAIPIYIATALITYRKKEMVITITIPEKIKSAATSIKKIFVKSAAPDSEPQPEIKTENDTKTEPAFEYPSDMPRELYIPFQRAKQNAPLTMAKSAFNESPIPTPQATDSQNESFPIPSDFDISDSLPNIESPTSEFTTNDFPVFKDIDFDIPIENNAPELSNSVTKYCDEQNIEYETYHDFVATEKYLIYDHDDPDFWVMDDTNWFSSKRQIESPISEMISLARQNELTPVLYLESQNIMDLPGTIEKIKSMGVRVITSLDEL